MNRHLLRGLLALYPRAFQDRYGTELARLTDELISAGEITPLLAALNLAGGAALEWGRVLTSSRRAALTVAAAAVTAAAGSLIVAVAGLSYVTGHARPPSMAASVPSARVVLAQPAAGCAVTVNATGSGAVRIAAETNAAAEPGRTTKMLVPVVVLLPGTFSIQAGPSPSAVPLPAQLGLAGPCMIWLLPPSINSDSGVAMAGSGFATSRNLTVGSVLTIDGVKFRLIRIVDQPQASNPFDVFVPLNVAQRLPLPSGSPQK